MSLPELLSSLGGSEARRAKQYIEIISTNFKEFVEELCTLHENLPDVITRLKKVRDEVDERHKTTSYGVAAGATTSIFASLVALLVAPLTAGASVGIAAGCVTFAGAATSITSMSFDASKQSYGLKCSEYVAAQVKVCHEKAEKAFNEFKETSELLRALISRNFPEFKRLDEDTMYQLSILIGTGMISQCHNTCLSYLQSIFRGSIAVPHMSTCVALARGVTSVSTEAIIQYGTRLAITNGAHVLGTEVAKSAAPIVASKVSTSLFAGASNTVFNHGVKVMTKTTAFNRVGAVVINEGGKTLSITKHLQGVTRSTVKDYAPVVAKLGTVLSIAGMAYDAYTGYQAFQTIFNDRKCSASQAITEHIEELENLQLTIGQCLSSLQPTLESVRSL